MLNWMKNLQTRQMEYLTESARRYLIANLRRPEIPEFDFTTEGSKPIKPSRGDEVRYSMDISPEILRSDTDDVRYSIRDNYNSRAIRTAMRQLSETTSPLQTLKALDNSTDISFVEKMLELINAKGLRDSDVYKSAQIDRRLFSKIVSDPGYKPSKDTCVALCLALRLTLFETNDLLRRAGYVFSHSSRRDVILEFFFREGVYSLSDVNEILFRLNEKTLGRDNH